MKKKEMLTKILEKQKEKRKSDFNYKNGIIKRLLEKYRPIEGISMLDSEVFEVEERRAA